MSIENPISVIELDAMTRPLELENLDLAPQVRRDAARFGAAPTEKQQAFILRLIEERDATGTAYEGWTPDWSRATRAAASKVIGAMLAMPKKAQAAPAQESAGAAVADGHYALERAEVWRFYSVQTPTKGRWAGMTFLKVQAGDDYYPIRNSGAERAVRADVLAAIAADPAQAMKDYGLQLGRCGHCNRTLTNPESIERGIGPVCAGKMGW